MLADCYQKCNFCKPGGLLLVCQRVHGRYMLPYSPQGFGTAAALKPSILRHIALRGRAARPPLLTLVLMHNSALRAV